MTSLQFKIWRFLIKIMFWNKDKSSEFDTGKLRRFDIPSPPGRLGKRLNIEQQTFRNGNIFHIRQKNCKDDKLLLYFHGGAFVAGISRLHWNFIERLAAFAYPIILPAYPLAPENDYRHTSTFLFDFYQHLLKKYEPDQIYVLGDSAGGNLAVSLSLLLNKNGVVLPKKLLLLSPWLDLTMNNPRVAELEKKDIMLSANELKQAANCYANNASAKNPQVSPIFGDLGCLPETHYFIGTHDILYADAMKVKEITSRQNAQIKFYEFEQMMHVWMLFPIPEAAKVIQELRRIIDSK